MLDKTVATSTPAAADAPPDRIGLRDVFKVWTRVSVSGIGGPGLQIATMHRLAVQKRRWISEERFFHALSYCIAMPGPETQQLAIYIGWLSHRLLGGIIAGGLFILPGAICMLALCFGFVTGADSQIGQAIFLGVKPAIIAIMIEAILRFGRSVLPTRLMLGLAAAAFAAAFFKISFPIIIIVAALFGFAAALAGVSGFSGKRHLPTRTAAAPHQEEELPDHTRPSASYVVRTFAICLALWFAPIIVLLATVGPASIYTQISLLFSKVALMAVGGDYAVIAYAAQQVVDSNHWITAREMQDGIAMGEMVPGTIMIVNEFLGFMAAYRDPGQLPPLVAGTLGGLLATWTTFAPCFLWIFVIAPFIEGLRDNALLDGPLRAVTAAAVGMIINLSVWFGIRTLFHDVDSVHYAWISFDVPDLASLDPAALALSVAAAIAVLRFRLSSALTLFASSAVGVLLYVLGVAG